MQRLCQNSKNNSNTSLPPNKSSETVYAKSKSDSGLLDADDIRRFFFFFFLGGGLLSTVIIALN